MTRSQAMLPKKQTALPIPKVAIALPLAYQDGQDKYNGILRYLAAHTVWNTRLIREELDLRTLEQVLAWGADGLITDCFASVAAFRFLGTCDLPTVTIDLRSPQLLQKRKKRIAHVAADSEAIGTRGAEYLLGQGDYQSFGFIGTHPEWPWSRTRAQAFRLAVEKQNRVCRIYPAPTKRLSPEKEQQRLVDWLHELPKPVAVLAASDDRARHVLELCLRERIRVPGEIALLGVDNEALICMHSTPTLSSIQPEFEEAGFQAASLLDRIMRGALSRPVTVLCNVKQIVGRRSTAPSSSAGKLVQTAAEFIRNNACKSICVEDVARHLRVSRRLADLRFRQLQGRSILEAVQEARLDRVTALLRTTTLEIGEIGELCGYHTETYLKRLFKKRFSTTMRDYRKRHRDASA